MLYDIFEMSKTQQKIIGINLYGDAGYFCGIVLDYSEEIIRVEKYTKYGLKDGVIIESIFQVERIDFDDDFTNSVEYLIKNQKKLFTSNFTNKFYDDLDEDNWQESVLELYVNEKKLLLSIQINGDDYFHGFIENKDEDNFTLRCIGNLGEDKGLAVFKIEDITSYNIDDIECRKRLLLYKNRKHEN
ncbi:hypothetical protein [Tenacibaculum sp. IB213877]|jgi:hypothetical protein|uniref:hypothetical protein n=1 Tax=Tenacibaculum sp. IB213877 TaxID=3097351 RepID=UPI002A59D63C|nr:hypothetical protein [Tenacibaculum sp. IB213877]MDY0781306.1 hypothetical protein [Tenacibaculum sp. IB213877]